MSIFKDRAAMSVLLLLATLTVGGAFLVLRSTPAEAEFAADAASGMSKKDIERIVHDYIVKNPEVLMEAMQNMQDKQESDRAQKTRAGIDKHAKELFNNASDFVAGNPNGDVTVVEFMDYRCGYCKQARPDVLKLLESDKNVRLVIKEFPILGPNSLIASRAAIAARKQSKYWDFHIAMMAEPSLDEPTIMNIAKDKGLDVARLKEDMKSKEVSAIIDANHDLASRMGIDSTPTFIFGKEPVAGAVSLEKMKAMVAAARKP